MRLVGIRSLSTPHRKPASPGATSGKASFVERKDGAARIDPPVAAAIDIGVFVPASGVRPSHPPSKVSPTFDDVYTLHAAFVWRILRGMGVTDAQIEDAVQDVFIVVHRRLGEFDGQGSLKTWLFQIAYRTACAYRRKTRRNADHDPFTDRLQARTRNPAEEAEQREALAILGEALDKIDDEKRAVLVLSDIDELTAPEIADITGTPLNTVYTRLRRARRELSQALRFLRGKGR